jgi:phosphoribosyl 1,2-cyclic phosphate phosphodiesterase
MRETGGRRLVFLGCGTSTGVPMLGCDCEVCRSTDPRNARTRASVMLEVPGGRILVDTSPEMRLQMLRTGFGYADAVVFTHAHADHLFGLDDIRLFPKFTGGPVPVYCEEEVEATIRSVFSYAFADNARRLGMGIPQIEFVRIEPGRRFWVLGQTIEPIRLEHGRFRTLGFRVGGLAYCTDVNRIPDESWPMLEGLDTLILDALRPDPHPTHFHLEAALEVVERLRPRRTYLTHLSHTYDYATANAGLPEGVQLAYDGLALAF